MTFKLDTSGLVQCPAPDQKPNETTGCWFWTDLSIFAQGYIEALFDDLPHGPRLIHPLHGGGVFVRFSDLAPETLARIITDCAVKTASLACPLTAEDGRVFWRKFGAKSSTVQLGEDGKVRFA